MLHTPSSGERWGWLFLSALRGEELGPALVSGFDWPALWHSPRSDGRYRRVAAVRIRMEPVQQLGRKLEGAPGSCSEVCGGLLHP